MKKLFIIALVLCFVAPMAQATIYVYRDSHGKGYMSNKYIKKKGLYLIKKIKGFTGKKTINLKGKSYSQRKKALSGLIKKTANYYKIDIDLFHALIAAESAYRPRVISKAGAVGLTQLMPATAKRMGVKNRNDPAQNLAGGAKYLKLLLKLFNGNKILAVAAYNAGEGAVKKYKGVPPYKETQGYVKKVIKSYLKSKAK